MFWGSFCWWGVGPLVVVDGNMDSDAYINILAKNFIPWANNLATIYPNEPQLTFQQDLASVHISKYSTWWMNTHGFKILDWAAHSPDLNPIENLWEHLDTAVRKRESTFSSKEELIMVVTEEWKNLSLEYLHALIGSMPRRIASVIKAKGWHTKY